MASRLKLKKKKKYHPPIDDYEEQLKTDEGKTKQQDSINSNNSKMSKTYAEVTISDSKRQPKSECEQNMNINNSKRMKTYAEVTTRSRDPNIENVQTSNIKCPKT